MVSKQPKTAVKKGRYDFTGEELHQIAEQLTEKIREHDDVKAEAKAAAKEFAGKVEGLNKDIRDLSVKHQNGHEYRFLALRSLGIPSTKAQ